MSKLFKILFFTGWILIMLGPLAIPAGYCDNGETGDLPEIIVSNSLRFRAKDTFLPQEDLLYLQLSDKGRNENRNRKDSVTLKLISALGADTEEVVLTETGRNTGIFRTVKGISIMPEKRKIGDGALQVSASSEDIITVAYLYGGRERTLVTLTSNPAIDSFRINVGFRQIADKPFAIEIEALDRKGDILTDYSSNVKLKIDYSASKPAKHKLSPKKTSFFAGGKARIFAVYPDAGVIKIIAEDKNGKTGESEKITFLPAAFRVEAQTKQIVGKKFDIKITALNYNNNLTSGYEGVASIKLLRGGVPFKKKIRFAKGLGRTSFTYNNWGVEKFVVCDAEYPDFCGISEDIFFGPYRLDVEIYPPDRNRKRFYVEEPIIGRVKVLDYQGRKIEKFYGVVDFEPVEDVDIPGKCYFGYLDSPGGEREFYLSGIAQKDFKLKAYDVRFPEAKGESETISLMSVKIKIDIASRQSDRVDLILKIVDKDNRIVSSDDSTVITVDIGENIPDGSAAVVGSDEVRVKGGVAEVTIRNTQKETVTMYIDSQPYIETPPKEITFK